jgi:hypothetical protein
LVPDVSSRHFLSRILCFTYALLVCPFVLADAIGYSQVLDLRTESGTIVAEHHHNWSDATLDARWKMISTTKDPFTSENTYSYLRLLDKASGQERFKKPVPALTYLWISPDSRYIVGLSNIMLSNPFQLVVFSRSGRRLLERNFIGDSRPGVSQSVTNWVHWYKEPVPILRLKESQKSMILTIEDSIGNLREFRFGASD